MSEKFKSVPVDEDTKILIDQPMKLGSYDVLYQKWVWEGVLAESFIFLSADVSALSDEELKEEARASAMIKANSKLTLSQSDSGYTFINFNFVTGD